MNKFVPVDHPPSLLGGTSTAREGKHRSGRREDLHGVEGAFLVEALLTRDECAHYVRAAEEAGFMSVTSEFPSEYRTNDRVMSLAPLSVERNLFKRLLPFLRRSDTLSTPMGPGTEGVWLPAGLNECFKFARYHPGGHFKPHMDGPWVPTAQKASIYTVVIYLNDGLPTNEDYPDGDGDPDGEAFVGGETNFLRPIVDDRMQDSTGVAHIKRSLQQHEVVCSVRPKAGSALVFKHELLHEGAPLLSGVKYILRTELVFERQTTPLTPATATEEEWEAWHEIERLYEASEAKLQGKDGEGFVEAYLAAIDLQKTHNKSASVSSHMNLPPQMLWHMMEYLNGGDLARLMLVNKAFYHVTRISPFWHRKLQSSSEPDGWRTKLRNGPESEGDDASADWYARCRNRYDRSKRMHNRPAIPRNTEPRTHGRWTKRNLPRHLLMGDTTEEAVVTVVIDNGSYMTKAGFAGDDEPRICFPSVVGRPRRRHGVPIGVGLKDSYVGYDINSVLAGLIIRKYPERRIVNWDDLEEIWRHTYSELKAAPEEHPILMTESVGCPRADRERMTQIMFEDLRTPAFYCTSQENLAMQATGRTTGILVDFGEHVTHVVPIHEGVVLSWAMTKHHLGGDDVTDSLISQLSHRFTTPAVRDIVIDIKEKLGFCSLNPECDAKIAAMQDPILQPTSLMNLVPNLEHTHLGKLPYELLTCVDAIVKHNQIVQDYEMPDGTVITLSSERFRCVESVYFNPYDQLVQREQQLQQWAKYHVTPTREDARTLRHVLPPAAVEDIELGPELSEGVQHKILRCVQKLPPDMRGKMLSNVVLSGGSSMFPGLADRLRQELVHLLATSGEQGVLQASPVVKVVGGGGVYGAWRGGSIVASRPNFQQMWITKEEYEEQGSSIVHTKAPSMEATMDT